MWTTPRKAAVAAAVAFLLLLVGGRIAAGFVVDLLWYRSVGYEHVFWTRWSAALGVRGAIALLAGGLVFANLWIVIRSQGAIRVRRRYGNIEIAERLPHRYLLLGAAAVALLTGWWLSGAIGNPIAVLGAFRAPAWEVRDPVFGQDLAFYVFRYPLLLRVQALLAVVVFWTLVLVCACYVWTGGIRLSKSELEASVTARRHVGVLAAALLLVFAWNLWLERYGLLLAGQGIADAPGYTDVVARIPGRSVVALLALLASASLAYGAWFGRPRIPLAGIGTLIVGALLAQLAIPSLIQRLRVEPDELAHEAPFIRHSIELSRYAYGLADLHERQLPYRSDVILEPSVVARAIERLPVWDPRPLLETYRALEARQRYYNFVGVHYDRYSGRQVAISVRELEPAGLADIARTWQNLHLTYVRGEGAVVTPAARFPSGGRPPYYVSDLCPIQLAPDAPGELELTDPGIYFGELTQGYILVTPAVPTDRPAECPVGAVPRGVSLDSWWVKFAYAWAFQSKNLLLSDAVTPGSSIVYRRSVRERAARVAPFLLFPDTGGDLYPVVHDGRVVWILEGYTASASFPFAPLHSIGGATVRYVRNSVKVTVDAVTGEVRLYAMDPTDPVLQTYSRVFPELFLPIDEMPAGLRAHLRYPAPLLELQAEVLELYHVRSPREVYSRENAWEVPNEVFRDISEPYSAVYLTMTLPGSEEPEFLLTIPFVAAGRQNLVALMFVRNDPPHYGETIVYQLPRDEGVPGPRQIEAAIDQDPEISQQLSLWRAGGSDVIRGHLLIVPVDSTLVFVEPLYLEAQTSAIPQLERLVLVTGDTAIMRSSPAAAIAALVGEEGAEEGPPGGPTRSGNPTSDPTAADSILERVRMLIERAEDHLRDGEWAEFGETWDALREILRSVPDARSTPELAAPDPPR